MEVAKVNSVLYYANYFLCVKEEHPEDYKLVMRKDVVEKELADEDQNRYK
jgi:hypothetical protein